MSLSSILYTRYCLKKGGVIKLPVFVLTAFLWGSAPYLTAGTAYSVTDLGTLGGIQTSAYGINNAGQVVGESLTANSEGHAFLYTNGQMQDLGTLGGPISVAYSVNNVGQVTGASRNSPASGTLHGFLYTNGQMSDIGTIIDSNTHGSSINDSGQIAGVAYISASSSTQHAFLYSNGQLQDLGAFAAYSINNAGQIAGSLDTPNGTHALLYTNGQMQDLGTLPGGQTSIAYAVNNAGEVTGVSYNSSGAVSVNHAFAYINGQLQDIGTLGGNISIGQAINNAGMIVGASSFSTASRTVDAFVYANGQMQDLNNLVDPALHLTLNEATGINDSGDIIANGNNHAYLLTPVPEPGTVGMLFAAAVLAYGARSRASRKS